MFEPAEQRFCFLSEVVHHDTRDAFEDICSKFHQRFTSAFLDEILAPKKHKWFAQLFFVTFWHKRHIRMTNAHVKH